MTLSQFAAAARAAAKSWRYDFTRAYLDADPLVRVDELATALGTDNATVRRYVAEITGGGRRITRSRKEKITIDVARAAPYR